MNALPHNADKATTAKWMGYGESREAIKAMDRDHDGIHASLCRWLGIPSHSLMIARGEQVSPKQQRLAGYEEDAVLTLQRMIQHFRNEGEL